MNRQDGREVYGRQLVKLQTPPVRHVKTSAATSERKTFTGETELSVNVAVRCQPRPNVYLDGATVPVCFSRCSWYYTSNSMLC